MPPEAANCGFRCPRRSSPETREGFRCPLFPLDRAGDVVAMLVDLLRDCRVTDIRTLAGVHADRTDGTGLPLLFKPESIPDCGNVLGPLRR